MSITALNTYMAIIKIYFIEEWKFFLNKMRSNASPNLRNNTKNVSTLSASYILKDD